jgi:hypothetical protein
MEEQNPSTPAKEAELLSEMLFSNFKKQVLLDLKKMKDA